jgi:hypothetical protein
MIQKKGTINGGGGGGGIVVNKTDLSSPAGPFK